MMNNKKHHIIYCMMYENSEICQNDVCLEFNKLHLEISMTVLQMDISLLSFYLPPKEIELFFVLKVVCPLYTFSLPNSDNFSFLGLSKCLPNFYLPWAIRQVLI